jgi:hypothetical protein
MKKLITLMIAAIAFAIIAPTETKAQGSTSYSYQRQSLDSASTSSSTGTNYATVLNVPSHVKSITAKVIKISGTFPTGSFALSGVYSLLQGSNDNSNWEDIGTDSLKCANQATNVKTWTVTSTSFNSYRIITRLPSSTASLTSYVIYTRRQDE